MALAARALFVYVMFLQLTAVKLACVCVFVWERERERESCTTNIRIDSLTIEPKTFLTYGCLCGESNTLDLLLFCKRVRVYTAETGKNCVWCERIQNFNFYSRLFVSLVVSLKENHAPVLSFFVVGGSAVPQSSIQCDLLSIVISALCFFVSRLLHPIPFTYISHASNLSCSRQYIPIYAQCL